ncbi:MAG: hypothetical protein PUD74_04915 [Bacteroidales bacterium]|nr:hypothetical protein [Bacteroidales bacterium]
MNFMKIGGSTAWRIITQPISDRSLFGVITGLRHVDLAHRFFRAISAWLSSHLSALRHGDPAHRYFRGISAWRTITQPISKRFLSSVITGLRHVDLAHRFFRTISAWRSSHLSALRHGDPAQRYPRGIILWRDGLKPVIYLCLSMKLAFFMDIEV